MKGPTILLSLAWVAATATATSAQGNSGNISWSPPYYPPNPNSFFNLSWAVDGSGAPGTYTSSHTPRDQYGTYNWCAMPHVRKHEYSVPPKEYELVYVEVIQRHHKRTPYQSNTLPKEDVAWDCENQGPYHHGKARSFKTTPVYWQVQHDLLNPFEATVPVGFGNSTCKFPDITTAGLEDSRQHGKDFKGVYRDLLGFLPSGSEKEKYAFRVTNNVITTETLSGFVKGLYPSVREYPAWVQAAGIDSLEPSYSCPYADKLLSQNQGPNPAWQKHLNASAELRRRFDDLTGVDPNDEGWHKDWDHAYDNLSAKQCHQKLLPCSSANASKCLSQEDADTIYRLGNYEYGYRYRGSREALMYSALKSGAWLGELVAHLQDAAEGERGVKYRHNFAHDGSVSPLLGVLQLASPIWPGMGSEVVFELWLNSGTRAYHVRVLLSGQTLQSSSPLGSLDMIPLDQFVAYLDQVLPQDLVEMCKNGSP